MNSLKKIYCRCYQITLRLLLPFLPYKDPKVYNQLEDIKDIFKEEKISKPLVITDDNLEKMGETKLIKDILKESNYVLFAGVYPNPTTDLVKEAKAVYIENGCDGLIAYGGGSPIDVAKAVGASLVRPNKELIHLRGILKVRKKIPTLVAIPTTAGTGSETTLASVIVDSKTRCKFAINDFPLIPKYAILDTRCIHNLPTSISASTALDALTHAVEAYIGRSTTKKTRSDAIKAIKLIFKYYDEGVKHQSKEAERALLKASHLAGRAFTRSYVGYIHALSHSLSGMYDLPHGWTNAVLMPIVLRRYGKKISKKLAFLAREVKLGTKDDNEYTLAQEFINKIEMMARRYDIPSKIKDIKEEDIPLLAKRADKEANPLYPVPVLYDKEKLEEILREVKG